MTAPGGNGAAGSNDGRSSRRPLVGFLSDLGLLDDAVAMCKGLMLRICPEAQIIDVTHLVTAFDVREGAQYLGDLPRFFPTHSVFACVVYPETGRPGTSIALRNDLGQVFVAPNNGLLTRVIEGSQGVEGYEVRDPEVIQSEPTSTFYGRDIVASAAAHLAGGFPLAGVGPRLSSSELNLIRLDRPSFNGAGELLGEVSTIDRNFGNVWTNIPSSLLTECGISIGMEAELDLGGLRMLLTLSRTFSDVGDGDALLYINSRGYLSMALNKGNFAQSHMIERETPVRVRWSPQGPSNAVHPHSYAERVLEGVGHSVPGRQNGVGPGPAGTLL